MVEVTQEILNISWTEFLSYLAIIIVGFPVIKNAIKNFEKESKITLPWTNRQREINQRFEAIEKKYIELNEKIDNSLKTEHDNHEIWHQQSIDIRQELKNDQDSLKNDVKALIDKFDSYILTDNKRTIATLRTSLWRMHRDFMEQGYVTPDGLKTFKEMGVVYEEAGGNDIYHEKLKPEVLSLEIRYPDGGAYDK